jgi:hypothetical protein
MRDLIVTENITLDGVIDAAGGWFAPAGDDADVDQSDVEAALREQSDAADALLLGRVTFEDMRGYWPLQADDTTGITDYLNKVSKYVVSAKLQDPAGAYDRPARCTARRGQRTEVEGGPRHRDDRQHDVGERAHRRRSGGRVPAVPVPGRARARPPVVRRH